MSGDPFILANLIPPDPEKFRVHTPADFARVESYVSTQLSCDGDRCAFLRSAVFLRFRMRALYKPRESRARCWGPNGLLLEFSRDKSAGPRSAWVTVSVMDHLSEIDFDASWGAMPKVKVHS